MMSDRAFQIFCDCSKEIVLLILVGLGFTFNSWKRFISLRNGAFLLVAFGMFYYFFRVQLYFFYLNLFDILRVHY